MRFTKITASVGPSTESKEQLQRLKDAGVSVFRLNFSHDVGDIQGARVKHIRKWNTPVAIIGDLQGPKHRIGDFKTETVTLKPGQTFILDNIDEPGDAMRVSLMDEEVLAALKPNDIILMNDGKQELKVTKSDKNKIETTVIRGGDIKGRRGFNLPNTELNRPILTQKDRADLEYILTKDIDFVAVSFVQKAEDISEVRDFITEHSTKPIKIIAKIERPQALPRITDIIKNSDGIMLARGDLAVEVPFYEVPTISRNIIKLCRDFNKPVIVATQMLSSMTENEFPTRSEISDVATCSYLRADSGMTSEETTVGKHPVFTIETMAKILEFADNDGIHNHCDWTHADDIDNAWSKSVVELAKLNKAAAIVIFTNSGENARTISSRRPDIPIVAVCKDSIIANQMCLYRGVFPIMDKKIFRDHDFSAASKQAGINSGFAVIVEGPGITLQHI